ncbi:MAG: DJ-1/PfpI family protein [Pirellulaceae bacterium]|nr:DJ-1/PfpI family protein [Pirellulaceae bacterium]
MNIENIGVVIFDGVERLDIEGPLGVLGWSSRVSGNPLSIRMLSKHGRPVKDHLIDRQIEVDGATTTEAGFDLLLVPGGDLQQFGNDLELVSEIRRLGSASQIVASVCTGAFLVAQTGLADGKSMTTHWQTRTLFRQRFPSITLSEHRFESDGNLWSSAGISAGIDMSLRLVASLWGTTVAKTVQDFLEYFPEPPYAREQNPQNHPPTV